MSSSNLSVGIVGLPNVGKSTLFRVLTQQEVDVSNYPFATIDPNIGIATVEDDRLEKLTKLSDSKKTIPAIVNFVDIAGLVRGAGRGEGLGNKFLAHIREVDLIVYVVPALEDSDVHHVEGTVDPKRDVEVINTELALKDLETIEKRLSKVRKDEKGGVKGAKEEREALEALNDGIADGKKISYISVDLEQVKHLQLLSVKPGIFLVNTDGSAVPEEVTSYLSTFDYPIVEINIREEYDAIGFGEQERKELGLMDSALSRLIATAYESLNLITFFTTGEAETRAWSIVKNTPAAEAAGVIHTDFTDRFIAMQVINWEQLITVGGWTEARAKGLIRSEGKEYVVQDGDVVVVMHDA